MNPTISSILWVLVLGLVAAYLFVKTRATPTLRLVAILVLGDVGRSPRMMYHAESFARNGFTTYLIGNKGSTPIPSLLSLPLVRFVYLPDSPKPVPGIPFVLFAPRKILLQIIAILEALLVRIPEPPEFILVQNPPSIPTLALVWLVGTIRGSKVIIDWHNLGYSILALRLGEAHPFVKIAKWFEAYFGRTAYAHLFVTKAMHDRLYEQWCLRGRRVVLHDRPPAHFHRASAAEMHELFIRLLGTFSTSPLIPFLPSFSAPHSTPFTEVRTRPRSYSNPIGAILSDSPNFDHEETPGMRADRPALLVSSTSWTPDEDFGMLLEALGMYEEKARSAKGKLPKVLMVVTGKGPDRDKYMKQVERLQAREGDKAGWEFVRCVSMWLEASDYPLLLGSADLGISLHSSSSGIDLPMKVVDMFGCGLPVCALDFACLDELVKDGVNGLVFRNAEQLATQIANLLEGFPTSPTLEGLRSSLIRATPIDQGRMSPHDLRSPESPGVRADSPGWPGRQVGEDGEGEWEWCSWSQNWDRVMKPILLSDLDVSAS